MIPDTYPIDPIKFDPAIFPIDPVVEAELRRDSRRIFKEIVRTYNNSRRIFTSSREQFEREWKEFNRLTGDHNSEMEARI